MPLSPSFIEQIVRQALEEDLGQGDVTTDAIIPPDLRGEASVVAEAEGIVAGVSVAAAVFHRVDPSIAVEVLAPDGTRVSPGEVIMMLKGPVAGILQGERTALNFLQRLSGIASETARYVEAIEETRARIVDTRKTTPGLRPLEKYAVTVGGGHNHRFNLGDGILIKDNHLAALRFQGVGIREAIERARQKCPHTLKVEVEVETLEQAREVLEAGADALLLDNMSPEEMRQVVEMAQGRALIEASGGVNLSNVRSIAETGVDLISVGALTHSVRALDISLGLGYK